MSKLVKNKSGEGELSESTLQEVFQNLAAQKTIDPWSSEGTVLEKWSVMKSALIEPATASWELKTRCHPDWFRESADPNKPAIQH